jgi:hypothetical protein
MKNAPTSPGLLVALLLLATLVPGPLYLISLALLGLPHVLWELAYLRSRYAGRWPVRWWVLVLLLLGVQLVLRTAAWTGHLSSEALQVADLLVLLGLLTAVLLAPRGVGWGPRAAALVGALVLVVVLEAGHMTAGLLVLALVHNFTPVGLAWDLARDDPAHRPMAVRTTVLFLLPLTVVALGTAGWWPQPWAGAGQGALLAASPLPLLGNAANWHGGALPAALASAMVLAQCLHYHQVLQVLPAAQAQHTGHATLPLVAQRAAILASAALALYFAWSFADARQLYAVAAGFHAWLEWPVLLLVLLAPRLKANRYAPRPKSPGPHHAPRF